MKADHLTGVKQPARIVLLLGKQLNIVGTISTAIFEIVHVRISNKDPNRAAKGDHVVQPLLGREANHWNRPRNHDAVAILHEFNMEEDLCAITLAQKSELLSAIRRRKTALQIGICRVGL